jgi:hypothetical protein
VRGRRYGEEWEAGGGEPVVELGVWEQEAAVAKADSRDLQMAEHTLIQQMTDRCHYMGHGARGIKAGKKRNEQKLSTLIASRSREFRIQNARVVWQIMVRLTGCIQIVRLVITRSNLYGLLDFVRRG